MIELVQKDSWDKKNKYPSLGWLDVEKISDYSHFVVIRHNGYRDIIFCSGNTKKVKHELCLFLNNWQDIKGVKFDFIDMKYFYTVLPEFRD
jgi:hypothetical protein